VQGTGHSEALPTRDNTRQGSMRQTLYHVVVGFRTGLGTPSMWELVRNYCVPESKGFFKVLDYVAAAWPVATKNQFGQIRKWAKPRQYLVFRKQSNLGGPRA
jgi:hypothetical protein